jgi:Na+/proline symporter/nitrogen-specific signal transduction histidine kinase
LFRPLWLITAICLYVTALFAIALWVERGSARARRWARSPYTYSLAMAVYCTSWTFYGSVGSASTEGYYFLAIYLGPTLAAVLWSVLLRKLVRLKNAYRITSIADLISARYGKSQSLAALATTVAVVGTMPYIALQLRAVNSSFQVIAGVTAQGSWLADHVGTIVVVLMIVFTIVFGARRLDPTERHEGLLLALAAECLVKLIAFVSVGIFVTYFLFDGPGALFDRLATSPFHSFLQPRNPGISSALTFFSFLILAMSAIQFLPRQFHVAVVENGDERHVSTAAWLLPLYLLLINIFVIPLASAALLGGVPSSQIDTSVLQLPLREGQRWLSLLVFLGGFSAATGMIIVEGLAVSTMVTNHLLLPIIESSRRLRPWRRSLLRVRWAAITAVLLAGYLFERAVGQSYSLASIGIISFAAVVQFAPAILGGLFWRRGGGLGALLGMGVGSLIWSYTLLLPTLVRSNRLPMTLLSEGPFGIALLKPEALFGLEGLHPIAHGVAWSLLVNVSLYILGSLLWQQSQSEQRLAESFVGILVANPLPLLWEEDEASVILAEKRPMIEALLCRYFPKSEAEEIRRHCENNLSLTPEAHLSVAGLAALYGEIERVLAGSIGAAAASHAVHQGLVYTPDEAAKLPRVYARILANLKVSPADLKRRINYVQERSAFLEAQAALLEARVEERTAALIESNRQLQAEVVERQRAQQDLSRSNAELEQFAYVASHDLQEPLRTVASYLQLIERRYKDQLDSDANDFIAYGIDGAKRMQSLINDLLLFARIGTRGKAFVPTDCGKLVQTVLQDLRLAIADTGAKITASALPTVMGDDVQLQQLFLNLIGNAIKFHRADVPTVHVQATRVGQAAPTAQTDAHASGGTTPADATPAPAEGQTAPLAEWKFSVTDNGIGIEDRHIGQIFRLFHRLHTRSAYPGNGIGLALCKKIVERHQGRIWVESTAGQGTTFFFTLPGYNHDGG